MVPCPTLDLLVDCTNLAELTTSLISLRFYLTSLAGFYKRIQTSSLKMSLDDTPDQKPPALSVEILTETCPASSVDSSVTPSPTRILDSHSTRASSSSLPVQQSVTFAPLPKVAPRKRRSAVPLGVASRSDIMRRRRGYTSNMPNNQTGNSTLWTAEEIAEQRQRIHMSAEERRRREEEDPFVVLGKMVKVASKHIWRKVSNKDLSKQSKQKVKEETKHDEENEDDGDEEAEWPRPVPEYISPTSESLQALTTVLSNGESGQMEHRDDDPLLDVGQTTTVVEGHTKYSWMKEKSEELERPTSAEV